MGSIADHIAALVPGEGNINDKLIAFFASPGDYMADTELANLATALATEDAFTGAFAPRDRPTDGGHFTAPRTFGGGSSSIVSGAVYMAYFLASDDTPCENIAAATWSTAGANTPTLCRMGIYAEDDEGNLTLEAACANDVTLFGSTFTRYKRALTAPFVPVPGQWYAGALLVVSAATLPSLVAITNFNSSIGSTLNPDAHPLTSARTGQTDLPVTIEAGDLLSSNQRNFMEVLP